MSIRSIIFKTLMYDFIYTETGFRFCLKYVEQHWPIFKVIASCNIHLIYGEMRGNIGCCQTLCFPSLDDTIGE